MEGASGSTRLSGRAGIDREGDARDAIGTNGGSTQARAELGHLRSIFSRATGANSSLIFAECASRADSTEGEARIAVPATIDSHAVSDGSGSASGGDRLPVGGNGRHAFVDGLAPPLAVLFALVPLVPHPGVNRDTNDDK